MQPPDASPFADDAVYATFARLVRVQTVLWNQVDDALRTHHQVPLADLTCLELVAAREGCRVQDIVDTLDITVGGASKVVDRLATAGHVVRTAHPHDRRSSVLSPTEPGRRLLASARPTVDRVLQERLADVLTPSTLTRLDRILTTVQEAASPDVPGAPR